MSRELKLASDTGQSITAKIYASAGTLVSTVSLTETPSASGFYVGDFPAVGADTYDIIYISGGYVIGSETIEWDGTEVVSTDLSAITAQLNTIESQTDLIGSVGVTTTTTQPQGCGLIEITAGTDYFNADGKAFTFTSTSWPNLAASSVKFSAFNNITGTNDIDDVALAVVTPAGTAVVRLELSATQTAALDTTSNVYTFTILATLANAHKVELHRGSIMVHEAIA